MTLAELDKFQSFKWLLDEEQRELLGKWIVAVLKNGAKKPSAKASASKSASSASGSTSACSKKANAAKEAAASADMWPFFS